MSELSERERFLEHQIAILREKLVEKEKEKRKDLVEARFIKYELYQRQDMGHEILRQIPFSPGNYEHRKIYRVPPSWLKYPWWRRV